MPRALSSFLCVLVLLFGGCFKSTVPIGDNGANDAGASSDAGIFVDGGPLSDMSIDADAGVIVIADAGGDAGVHTCGGLISGACPTGMYCRYFAGCGGSDIPGVCVVRPDDCPAESAPVCGCDARTYSNSCWAQAAEVSIAHSGACEIFECGGTMTPFAAPFEISPRLGLSTSEDESIPPETFTIEMQCAPTSDVIIEIMSSDTTEGTVSPSAVVFTTTNWSLPRTVSITGVADGIEDGGQEYFITFSTTSADPSFDGVGISSLRVTNYGVTTPTGRICGGPSDFSCNSDEYCQYPESDPCGATSAGECMPRPATCEGVAGVPVCGCDGGRYASECYSHFTGESVAALEGDPECPPLD